MATQAWVNVNLGYQGLELMRTGLSVKNALSSVLEQDQGRARRQLVGIDAEGVFGFTGEECSEAKGHLLGSDFAVAGNILTDESVLEDMGKSFKGSRGDLAHRLLGTIEAGQAAGGDRRGKMSAALLVASTRPKLFHNLRIDLSEDPVRDLRTLFEKCSRLEDEYGTEEEGEELGLRVARVQR